VTRSGSLPLLVVAALALARSGLAADAPQDASQNGSQNDLGKRARFRADHLELDSKRDRLELDGNVVVTVDRYRLTSDRLSLERGPRGVVVEGGGRVAFCPCPSPPLTIGFRSATVAPPTDLLLEQPTVRAFGVPVLWLPYLWLRSPRRLGLLPLQLAYRGEDGLLLGSGVHVPLGEASSLDVGGAGYVKGGAEVDARLVTPSTATAVRWDHLHQSAVSADLRGAVEASKGASVTWSAAALRGGRALSGPALLEEVALRQDRAALSLGGSTGAFTAGVEARAAGTRGGPLDSGYAWSPSATAAFGSALGFLGAMDASTSVTTWRTAESGAVTLATGRAEARADAHAGAIAMAAELRSRGTSMVTETDRAHSVMSGASVEVGVPLAREYGDLDDPIQHLVVPFATALAGFADSQGFGRVATLGVYPAPASDGAFQMGSVGIRTVLGQLYGARSAASLGARVAEFGQGGGQPARFAAWRASAQAGFFALRSDGLVALDAARRVVSSSLVRLGAEDGLRVTGRATGRSGELPLAARLVQGDGTTTWDAPWVPWLEVPGWSIGGGVSVPWARLLATAADVDYDATSGTLLGVRGSVGYRHPCRCLALTGWGSHRIGRPGADVWITLDLMP
jgi:hypothetical protein